MAMGDSNTSESLVVLVHLFTRLDQFSKHCWGAPLIHPRFRKVTFCSKVASSLRFAFGASWKVSWITVSCSSLATTFAVSLQEFQSFQSFFSLCRHCTGLLRLWRLHSLTLLGIIDAKERKMNPLLVFLCFPCVSGFQNGGGQCSHIGFRSGTRKPTSGFT